MSDAVQAWAEAREVGIFPMAVPTPFAIGHANLYLIEDDPLTLIDTGTRWAAGLDALGARLADLGRAVEDLERIVITHQHVDHLGGARHLAVRSGAEVVCLDLLAPYVETWETAIVAEDEYGFDLMRANGVPSDVVDQARADTAKRRKWAESIPVDRRMADGDLLPFRDRSLRVLHRPGHSPSDTLFWDETRGILFGGDHLLSDLASNAMLAPPLLPPSDGSRPRPLLTYRDSLRATRDLDARIVLGGHGDPITRPRALIEDRLAVQMERARSLLISLDAKPRTAFELALAVMGAKARTSPLLAVSRIIGSLDLLLAKGLVTVHEYHGGEAFAATEA